MKVNAKSSGEMFTILAADHYVAVPVTVAGTALVPAGTPLTSAGAKTTTLTSAVGVLLYDVDPTVNPNGAMLIHGVIDAEKSKAHSSVDLAGITETLPGVTLRANTGVQA